MRSLILMGALLAALTSPVLADENTSDRRVDTGTYQIDEPTQPAGAPGAAAVQAVTQTDTRPVAVPAELAQLRARHMDEVAALVQALAAARDQAERASLELQAQELKIRQQREELTWLRTDAATRGDAAYAARLDDALRDLEPRTAPVATATVPRDPVTGRSLDGREEGGSK